MSTQTWELQQRLSTVLPLSDDELKQIISHAGSLSKEEACIYFIDLLGDSSEAQKFVASYREARSSTSQSGSAEHVPRSTNDSKTSTHVPSTSNGKVDSMNGQNDSGNDKRQSSSAYQQASAPPAYGPPPGRPPNTHRSISYNHTNQVIEAARTRAIDEVSCISQAYRPH